MEAFEYANLTHRPPGRLVAVASRLMPGVGRVQRQVEPYAASWRAANLAAIARGGARWIVLGDSMSQGIGASRFDAGWVDQVRDRLAAAGRRYEIINLSASGARVADVIDSQLPAWRSLPPGGDGAAELVTLLIGSNDLISKRYRGQFPVRFAQLLEQLPAGTVVATLPNPRRAAAEANALLEAAREQRGLVIAEMRGGRLSSWRGRLAEDHFHPNDRGYAGIAEVFHETISDAISSAATP